MATNQEKPEVELDTNPLKPSFNSLTEALNYIQCRLKAPKDKKAGDGQRTLYKYRSAEDILQNAKALMNETGIAITIGDEIITVNGRDFIEATATLRWKDQVLTNKRQAELPKTPRTNLDPAQQTGSCSSYAGKYALCGLLAIDDNTQTDPDAIAKTISPVQIAQICNCKTKQDMDNLCAKLIEENIERTSVIVAYKTCMFMRNLKTAQEAHKETEDTEPQIEGIITE